MRARALVAIGLVVIPSLASAQQRPRIRMGGQPPRATPSGPQPRVVSEAMRYHRLNFAVEGYTQVSRVGIPAFGGMPEQSFTTGGSGTRLEYRFHRMAAGTLDLTSSFFGGPMYNQTAELGLRVGPSRASGDIVPFVDVRAGYFYSLPKQQLDQASNLPLVSFARLMRYSYGPGVIGGGGIEFAATRRFSVTTAATYARANLRARDFMYSAQQSGYSDHYTMTALRYVIALRYNGVRAVPPTR